MDPSIPPKLSSFRHFTYYKLTRHTHAQTQLLSITALHTSRRANVVSLRPPVRRWRRTVCKPRYWWSSSADLRLSTPVSSLGNKQTNKHTRDFNWVPFFFNRIFKHRTWIRSSNDAEKPLPVRLHEPHRTASKVGRTFGYFSEKQRCIKYINKSPVTRLPHMYKVLWRLFSFSLSVSFFFF